MSQNATEAVLGRCVMDADYRILLFADPGQALAGYDLTKEERAALLSIDAETLDAFAERLSERFGRRGQETRCPGDPARSPQSSLAAEPTPSPEGPFVERKEIRK